MPHGLKPSEIIYYKLTLFDTSMAPVSQLDMDQIDSRKTECIFERDRYYPADYFFFKYSHIEYFGRKTLSQLFLENKQQYKKCNQLTANMLVGMVSRTQISENGVMIFYKPLENPEKLFLFNYIKYNLETDIYFPFPVIKDAKEDVQQNSAWDPSESIEDQLNAGEEHIRQYTLSFLKQFDLKGKIIFDPACSTGKFIDSIKKQFPEAKLIGQDMNPKMIELAKKNSSADELHVGNALYPCVSKESVDFIFLRFLNLSVISTDDALRMFCKIANCCKLNGKIVVFGFTPVLLSKEIFEILNLKVIQTIAYSKENDSVFQYYVLDKIGPVQDMRYKDFSIFKFPQHPFERITKAILAADLKEEPSTSIENKKMA